MRDYIALFNMDESVWIKTKFPGYRNLPLANTTDSEHIIPVMSVESHQPITGLMGMKTHPMGKDKKIYSIK